MRAINQLKIKPRVRERECVRVRPSGMQKERERGVIHLIHGKDPSQGAHLNILSGLRENQ